MYSVIIGVCILAIFSGVSADYPSDLPRCRMGNNKCVTEVVQMFASNNSDGIPSINLPSLEPLFIGKLDMIRERKSGILKILSLEHVDWRNINVKIYGLKNTTITITGFEKNVSDSNVIITTFMPNATYTADYDLNLKFLQRQINGIGKLRFEFENWEFRWSFKPNIYEKDDGKKYMRIDHPEVDYSFTAADLNFGIISDGIDTLNLLENTFLKQNGKLLVEVIKPECCAAYARAFTDIVEPIFSKFSIDELFLIDE